MANNFQRHITLGLPVGNCVFVSKAGADASDGLTPDTPKLTVLAGLQVARPILIIGAGVYEGEQVATAVIGKTVYADGTVVLQGDSSLQWARCGSLPALSLIHI